MTPDIQALIERLRAQAKNFTITSPIRFDINDASDALEQFQWRDISSAPRDVDIDTAGTFLPHGETETRLIRLVDDYMSSLSPYPLCRTNHSHDGIVGTYRRTHWKPIAPIPDAKEAWHPDWKIPKSKGWTTPHGFIYFSQPITYEHACNVIQEMQLKIKEPAT